ncbi:MAG: sugar phosphate isomerase/epimerase [Planctomycetes bacterium]|nr:sugar phosphate isomerase/epimerase [Planctomycetota bacterium]
MSGKGKKIYKAINYWVLGGFDGKKGPYSAIEDAAAWGLGLEMTVGDCLAQDITKAECQKIKEAAKKAGVGLRTLATGFYWGCSLGSPDAEERQKAVAFTKAYLKIASWLGAETVLVVPGAVDVAWDPSRPVLPYQQVWDLSSQSLKKLLPLAEDAGVNIALENVWNKFLISPIETKVYIDQFSSGRIGSYFDTGNCMISGYAEHWIEILGSHIKAVHLKNFKREDAGGLLHGFGDDLMKGDLDFAAVGAALNKHAPGVPVTAEMIPFCRLPDLVLPDKALADDTARKLLKIWPTN